MANVLTPWPKFQALDTSGNLANGYKLYAFAAGTSNPKDTFPSQSSVSANAHPTVLNSRGEADIWLEDGSYKFILRTDAEVDVWTVDNISSAAQDFRRYESIALMTAVNPGANGTSVMAMVTGFTTAGDGGGGLFYFDPDSSATADGGIVFAPDSGTGRWIRLFEGPINVKWFGVTGDGATDDETNVSKVITYVSVSGQEHDILFDNGTFKFSSSVTFPAGLSLRRGGDAKLSADGGTTLTINSTIDQTCGTFFTGAGSYVFGEGSSDAIYGEWFGATGDGTTDDVEEIQAAIDAAAGSAELKTVKLRAGVFNIGSSLQITTDNIQLVGSGPLTTQIKHAVNSDNALDLSTGTTVDFASIRDIGFQSDAAKTNIAIATNDCQSLEIENVYISGFQDGISLATAIDTNITNVRTTNIQRYGIAFDSATVRANLNNCVLDSDKGSGTSGLYVNGAEGVVCSGVSINDQENGVTVENASSLFFSGSVVDSLTNAFLMNGGSVCISSLFLDDPGTNSVFKLNATNTLDLSVLHAHVLTTTASPTSTFNVVTGGTMNLFVGALTSDDSTLEPDGANYSAISGNFNEVSFKGSKAYWANEDLSFATGALLHEQNASSTSSGIITSVPSGETTGDSYFGARIGTSGGWTFGLHNSDTDAFVISNSGSLGTNNGIKIDTSENVSIPNGNFFVNGQDSFLGQGVVASGTTLAINWNSGQGVLLDLSDEATISTVTLSNPVVVTRYFIKFSQGSSTPTTTFTWPGTVIWDATDGAFVPTNAINAVDLVELIWDGTVYMGKTIAKNMS